jgi:peptidyl-prolyl cis-trans isomerase D
MPLVYNKLDRFHMLDVFRRSAQNRVVKGLMLILVLTFVLWGVGDIIRKHNKVVAFKVGNIEYTDLDWHKAFQQYVQRMSAQFQKHITPDEIRENNLHMVILNQLINSFLIQEESRDLGIIVSDDMVKYELATIPELQTNGSFDREKFQYMLRSSSQTEDEFIKNFKTDIAQQNLIMSLTLNREVSKSLINNLMEASNSLHNAQIVKIAFNDIKVSETPKDEDLQTIYKQNIAKFSFPEKRNLSYIQFGLNDIKTDENVSDQLLQEQYESKKAIFTEPEKRKVQQMVFKDESQAQDALRMLQEGSTFATVAKKFFPNQKNFSMGEVSAQGFDKDIADGIFSTEVGKNSRIIQSPLGFHIFLIESNTPTKIRTFAEVRDAVKKQYIEDARFEALSKTAQDIDIMIAAGSDLSSIAEKHGLKIGSVKEFVDSGEQKDKIAQNPVFRQLAVTTEERHASLVTPLSGQDQFIVVSVDAVAKQPAQPFDEVKDKVRAIWLAMKQAEIASTTANNVYSKLSNGGKIEDIVKEFKLTTPQTVAVSFLNPKASDYPDNVIEAVLAEESNKATRPIADDKKNYYIAYVTSISKAPTQPQSEQTDKLSAQLQQQAPNEIILQYLAHLRKKHKVEVYDEVINTVIKQKS